MENLTTRTGELFAAIQCADVRQVKKLVAANVSPHQRNAQGQTAIALAARLGNPEILRLLRSAAQTRPYAAQTLFDAGAAAIDSPNHQAFGTYIGYSATQGQFLPDSHGQTAHPGNSTCVPSVLETVRPPATDHYSLDLEQLLASTSGHLPPAPAASPRTQSQASQTASPKVPRANFQGDLQNNLEGSNLEGDLQSNSQGHARDLEMMEAILQKAQSEQSLSQIYTSHVVSSDRLSQRRVPSGSASDATQQASPPQPLAPVAPPEPLALEEGDPNTSPLEAAVIASDLAAVRALLKAGADFRPSNWYDTPVLVTAATEGNTEIVQALIAAGANPNIGCDQLPLHAAAEKGHLAVAHCLLNAGAHLEGQADNGRTALMAAAAAGQLPIVEFLVARGANINAVSQGLSAVMLAAQNGHQQVYEFLYPRVSLQIRRAVDRSSRQAALPANAQSGSAAETSPQAAAAECHNPLEQKLVAAAGAGQIEPLLKLLEAGVDVNSLVKTAATGKKRSRRRTALSAALQAGHFSAVEALLAAGADPNRADETLDGLPSQYPLMVAALSAAAAERGRSIARLVFSGARINETDGRGRTALMYAAKRGHVEALDALIQAGAALDISDRAGRTALDYATQGSETPSCSQQCQQAARLLRQASACHRHAIAMLQAVTKGDIWRVKQLLASGASANAHADGMTALCQAAAKGHGAIVKLLIARGADINYRTYQTDLNPLLYAAYRGHLEIVKTLIAAGADRQVKVGDRLNALAYAKLGKQQQPQSHRVFDRIVAVLKNPGCVSR